MSTKEIEDVVRLAKEAGCTVRRAAKGAVLRFYHPKFDRPLLSGTKRTDGDEIKKTWAEIQRLLRDDQTAPPAPDPLPDTPQLTAFYLSQLIVQCAIAKSAEAVARDKMLQAETLQTTISDLTEKLQAIQQAFEGASDTIRSLERQLRPRDYSTITMVPYGRRIRTQRKALKLSQAKLGEMIGTTGAQICQWEKKENPPRPENILALSKVLGMPNSWLQPAA